ncbi:MAG: hypothetical protein OEZ36_09205 [Spirochaetota bacterium]|nr:hypothetical protein [Spirochaetota bacterium]
MTLNLNPIISKIKGKLKGLVFVNKKYPLLNGDGDTVYIRSTPGKRERSSIIQDNINTAFKIISGEYKVLKESPLAFSSWQTGALQEEARLQRPVTAYTLFQSYFMTLYTHTLGSSVRPEYLSSGVSLDYEHRAGRSWNSVTPKAYGTNAFGTGSYGR